MWQQIRNNPRAAVLAVLAHVIFIAVLLVSFTLSDDEDVGSKGPKLEVIKAEAIDEKQINAQLKRQRDAEQQQQQKIKDQARRKKEAQLREKKRKAEKKKQQAAEKKRLAAEKKHKLAEKKRKQKAAAEKKRKAEMKKKQAREKRLAEEKKRKEIERKRIEEELARQDAEMQQVLAADRQRQAAARQAANQREISKFLGLIKNEVTRHWTLPSQDVSGLSCEVKVRIIPNGEVIDVQIIKGSGNLAFDRSVEKAVYRAAPLPVPSIDSGLFDEFREVIFAFEPRDL